MAGLKLAKPTKQDFDAVYRFMGVMEDLTDNRMFHMQSLSDQDFWNEEDENEDTDYAVLRQIRKEVMYEFDLEEDELEEEHYALVMWRYTKWFFNNHPSALGRVAMCASAAMLNAFDDRDEIDTVEWKPEIEKAIDYYEETHKNDSTQQ